jgi:DNA-binding GntR family transcriptional regulator
MRTSLKQEAYEHLRLKLIRGELTAGSRLSTLALPRELKISNIPVREALHQLNAEGLVEHKPNAGCVVRTLDEQELEELYDLRELLECFAIKTCAQRISRQNLGELEDICLEMRELAIRARKATKSESAAYFWRIIETDLHFHQALIRAAGNRWLARAAEHVIPLSKMMHAQKFPTNAQIRWATARNYRVHTTLLRAIRRGHPIAASDMMSVHIRCGNPFYEPVRLSCPGGIDAYRPTEGK